MTTKDQDLECYWINLEIADKDAFIQMLIKDINKLQRYNETFEDYALWEYLRYDDIISLLK